jgi:hypothetical protein
MRAVATVCAPERAARRAARVRTAARAALVLLVLLLTLMSPSVASAKPDTTIVGLTNAGRQLDGQQVIIQGEVVGDILIAENGYRWLMLQDGGASISVHIAESELAKITHLGRYNQVGTRLEVLGEFHLDCAEHDGLTDVHAITVSVVSEGFEVASDFDVRKLQVGGLLVFISLCLLVLHWRLRERTR